MDIKLGRSTITINTIKKGQKEIDRRTSKDRKTTSAELGFTVCGYCQKDPSTGEVISKEYKNFPPRDCLEPIFRKVFSLEGATGQVDHAAVDKVAS